MIFLSIKIYFGLESIWSRNAHSDVPLTIFLAHLSRSDRVSFCDHPLSGVRRRQSSYVVNILTVNTLEVTIWAQS